VDELEAQQASGRPAGGGGGSGEDGGQLATLRAQLEDLEEENKLLEERIARLSRRTQTVGGEQGGGEAETKTENRKLKQQVDELQEQLTLARQAQQQVKSGGGLSAAARASLGQAYEQLNALAAKVTSDMDAAAYNAGELKRLVELLERIDLAGLDSRDRRKLEMVLRDVNPKETLDNLEQMANSSLEAAKGARQDLRKLRDILEG